MVPPGCSHRIRLRGPWKLVGTDGAKETVQKPNQTDSPPGLKTFKRNFQWRAEFKEREQLLIEIPSETIEARLNGRPLRIVEADGRRLAEIGKTIGTTNELE